jgi:hypothetical protein
MPTVSEVLTIRVTPEVRKRLAREARRSRRSPSEMARAILEAHLSGSPIDPAAEARRQSLLASALDDDREALDFVEHVGDPRGWK